MPKSHRKKKMSISPVDLIFGHEDLLREVLLRIPAKQLLKLKCVCKLWHVVISNKGFCYEHTLRNPNPSDKGVYFHKRFPFPTTKLYTIPNDGRSNFPPLNFIDDYVMVNSCNGLILCKHIARIAYCVCNPTTQKYYKLRHTFNVDPGRKIFESLVFEPSKSPHYKVILLFMTKSDGDQIVIFSSEKRMWSHYALGPNIGHGAPATTLIYSNGSLHWLTVENFHYEFNPNLMKLTGYLMPEYPKIRRNNVRYFGDCHGYLCLVLGGAFTFACTILEWEFDTRVWAIKYCINLKNIISQGIGVGPKYFVLNVVKKSIHSRMTLVLATPGGFVSYHPESRTLEVLADFQSSEFYETPPNLTDLGSYTCRFIESLVPFSNCL